MKKVLVILTTFVFSGLVACGPSAAEKAEKATADSIAQADSLKMLEEKAAAAATDTATTPADTTKK